MTDLIFNLSKFYEKRLAFVLCIVTESSGSTPRKSGSKMIVFENGKTEGTVGGGAVEMQVKQEALEVLKSGISKQVRYQLEKDLQMQCGGNMTIYFEPFFPAPKLYIFGAGHVGREVGFYAQTLGFDITYIDHRPDIYNEFDAGNAACLAGDYVEMASVLPLNNESFAVITTPDHSADKAVLSKLAKLDLKYVGMMGSKRKVAEITNQLLDGNVLSKEQIAKVDMPIGLPIHAETPKEIAVSIVAKLIDVRNSQS
ncbi:MAG: XdhC family protein [Bacteroidetes bacterium]|nr:XdhC family protein [Bacteroidota bacterium]